jgi:uncharacterized protein (TIGR03083 family)
VTEPVRTAELFAPLQAELVALLRSLSPEDWARPTVAGSWRVKDVAAHLLDTDLRRLSGHRDGHARPPGRPLGYGELVALIDDVNAAWVRAAERLSPRVIADLLEWTGPQLADFFASLPPGGDAPIPVAWAGEERSANWMDVGREYTEKWHHQAQIRDAVGAPLLLERRWLGPVLALAVLALPHAFRAVEAPEGTTLGVEVDGDAGGRWAVVRGGGAWRVVEGDAPGAAARVRLDADAAWRLFFNALPLDEAARRVESAGDPRLSAAFLAARSVMV